MVTTYPLYKGELSYTLQKRIEIDSIKELYNGKNTGTL